MRALLAALLLLTARLPVCGAAADLSTDAEPADDADGDEDSDSAPFMIVVEHEVEPGAHAAGWRCSGSLVSLRTGVTSAECARGRRPLPARDMWAVAAATAAGLATRTDGARRVSRVATAGARQQEVTHGGAWSGAMLDLAVLELEKPFGSGARARPILMAIAPQECASGATCHVVRALARGGNKHMRLRIVDATLATDAPCAQLVRYWAALRERALCLTGPELCQPEWGAGVVCGGKLCGVVSRSAGPGAPQDCGDTHAAQSVARWRRFLHCAHTLRACGRGSCAELCSERQLLDENGSTGESGESSTAPPESEPAPRLHATRSTTPDALHDASPLHEELPDTSPPQDAPPTRVPSQPAPLSLSETRLPPADLEPTNRKPTRTSWTTPSPPRTRRTRPAPTPAPASPGGELGALLTGADDMPAGAPDAVSPERAPPAASPRPRPGAARASQAARAPHGPRPAPLQSSSPSGPVRPTPLFEPNRPDFRAGEYGDNAAEYGALGEEGGAGTTTAAATWGYAAAGPAGPRTPARNASAAHRRLPAVHSRRAGAPAQRVTAAATRTHAPPATFLICLCFLCI